MSSSHSFRVNLTRWLQVVGDQAKGRISKAGVTRKQSTPNFLKRRTLLYISYPLIRTPCNTCFEISFFALLPTKFLNLIWIFSLTIYCSRFYCLIKTQMNRSFACQGTRQFHFLFKILQGNISIHCHIQPGFSVTVTLFRIPVRNLIQNNELCTYPFDAGRKLNIHKTFLGCLLNILRMFNLCFVSGGGERLNFTTCVYLYDLLHFMALLEEEKLWNDISLDSVTTVFITDIGVSTAIMVSRRYLT